MSEKVIEFKNVNKWYGKFQVLKEINFHVSQLNFSHVGHKPEHKH